MVNVVLDGIWCKKCQDLHPTLMWHEKYNDYELRNDDIEETKIRKRFPDYDYRTNRTKSLKIKELSISIEKKPCIICKDLTYFVNTKTNNYVCSDECKYLDNKKEDV